jgi:hypothetical protein
LRIYLTERALSGEYLCLVLTGSSRPFDELRSVLSKVLELATSAMRSRRFGATASELSLVFRDERSGRGFYGEFWAASCSS